MQRTLAPCNDFKKKKLFVCIVGDAAITPRRHTLQRFVIIIHVAHFKLKGLNL